MAAVATSHCTISYKAPHLVKTSTGQRFVRHMRSSATCPALSLSMPLRQPWHHACTINHSDEVVGRRRVCAMAAGVGQAGDGASAVQQEQEQQQQQAAAAPQPPDPNSSSSSACISQQQEQQDKGQQQDRGSHPGTHLQASFDRAFDRRLAELAAWRERYYDCIVPRRVGVAGRDGPSWPARCTPARAPPPT